MRNLYSFSFSVLGAASAVLASPMGAYAISYLNTEEAQKVIFSEATEFRKLSLEISDNEIADIEKISEASFEERELKIWQVFNKSEIVGYFIVDEVWGKHEYITYALGITISGEVKGLEIMDYREAHGMEVIDPIWRKNFNALKASEPEKVNLNNSIPNISGATMSCKHITDGVRRNLILFQKTLKKLKHA